MKKKFLLAALVAICIATLASSTIAYFTAEDTAHNVITSGAVDVQIEEWQETDEGLVPYPTEEPIHIMPGSVVSKIVQIKNLEAESYIRAKFEVVFTFDLKDGETAPTVPDDLVSLNINGENWIRIEGDEEWWYYNGSVGEGAVTEPFFTEVTFSGPMMDNNYQNCTVEIDVKTQAVQAANNGSSVAEATGWPEA